MEDALIPQKVAAAGFEPATKGFMVPLHNNKRGWLVRRNSWPVAIPASKAQDALNDLLDPLGHRMNIWEGERVVLAQVTDTMRT